MHKTLAAVRWSLNFLFELGCVYTASIALYAYLKHLPPPAVAWPWMLIGGLVLMGWPFSIATWVLERRLPAADAQTSPPVPAAPPVWRVESPALNVDEELRRCTYCGRSFIVILDEAGKARYQIYCHPTCRNRAAQERHRERVRASKAPTTTPQGKSSAS